MTHNSNHRQSSLSGRGVPDSAEREREFQAAFEPGRAKEEALRESEERYRSILNASPDNITITDLQGRILMVSPAAVPMFGYERVEDALGRLLAEFVAPEDRDRASSTIALKFQGITSGPGEYRGLRKDGSLFDMEVNSDFIRGAEGQPIQMLFIVRDITARKRAKAALREEQLFSKSVIDSLPGIFFLYTYPELRLVLWNKQHESIFGYEAGEMEGRHATDWFEPEARDTILNAIEVVMEKGQNSIEAFLLTKEGRLLPFSLNGVKFQALGQSYLMGIGIDISARKQAEEALQKALKDIKTLHGILPICAWCKKIRDDSGYWNQVEVYVRDHSEAQFSHGICPECRKKFHQEYERD